MVCLHLSSQQRLTFEMRFSLKFCSYFLSVYFIASFNSFSRIKKLIDMDALGLSRLALVMLDMHTDMKGYSLLTLPQVRYESGSLPFFTFVNGKVFRERKRVPFFIFVNGIVLNVTSIFHISEGGMA